MRVNGLYGHVRSNDVRSLALFAGFVAAFHVLAALTLLVPLAMLDPEHAPLYGWTGYLVRWVPIVTIVGAILFAVQMAWHVRTVRRRTDFRFVDSDDEPRLCRIVEPLAIAAGLKTPYVGVIDSPALNAFACGIRQDNAVLVFTRGLIDSLDDDELAGVAAHEIIHIVNGDIRLIAATNVCLDTLKLLQTKRSVGLSKRIKEAVILPVLVFVLPLVVVLLLVLALLRRLAMDASYLTRLLIASSREFIADAEAVRLTQNPAALVSALRRIDGHSAIPGIVAGQDAMMIDGAHEGAFATHPTIADRVAAIISVTGSMVMNSPARRDTRPAQLLAGSSFGRRLASPWRTAGLQQAPLAPVDTPLSSDTNRLGLTPELTFGALAAVGVFLWLHSADLGRPSKLIAALDPAPLRTFFAMAGDGLRCQVQGIGWLTGLAPEPSVCEGTATREMLTADRGEKSYFDLLSEKMAKGGSTVPKEDRTFSSVPREDVRLAEVRSTRCFQTERPYSVAIEVSTL